MLATPAGGHADRSFDKRLAELVRPAVLIHDDFAMREHTPAQDDDLPELVSARSSAGKRLGITANGATDRTSGPAVPPQQTTEDNE